MQLEDQGVINAQKARRLLLETTLLIGQGGCMTERTCVGGMQCVGSVGEGTGSKKMLRLWMTCRVNGVEGKEGKMLRVPWTVGFI
jgi:hypothetical protein